jgi:hypothetical protein
MSEIEKQRMLVHTHSSESLNKLPKIPSDSFNIILSCCSDDKILSCRLVDRLTDEGYLVSIDYSDKPSENIESKINKTDLILISFTYNYSENVACMKKMISLKKSGKKILPIVLLRNPLNQDDWIQSMATEELFYESFEQEIQFKLRENFDFDYDQLLIELVSNLSLPRRMTSGRNHRPG